MVRLSALDKKLLRDLKQFRGQAIAVTGVIFAGIAAFFCFYSAFLNLDLTRRAYYQEYRFADLEIVLERAPLSEALQRVGSLSGIRHVEGRIVKDVNLELPGVNDPQFGRVISLPNLRKNVINDIYLVRGRYFSSDRLNEVIVNERFFQANQLQLGDYIYAVINQRKQPLRIVGTALSPEFVYAIPSANQFIPDDKRFAILWVKRDFAEMAFNMEGGCNNIVALVSDNQELDTLLEKAKKTLDQYGVYAGVKQSEQLSNYFLSNELKGLKTTAIIIAILFLGIAALILLIMMRRMVKQQRIQIGVIKAFGYSDIAVAFHFWKFALIIAIVATTLGIIGGHILGMRLIVLYKEFFQFPLLKFGVYPEIVFLSYLLSMLFAIAGSTGAVIALVRLPPAEAMRPETPITAIATPFEKIAIIWRHLSFTWKVVVRNVLRYRARSIFTVFGVMVATGIIIMGYFSFDSSNELLRYQFTEVQREDMEVRLAKEYGMSAYYAALRFPYTIYAEPMFQYAFEIRSGWRKKNVPVIGIPDKPKLRRFLDKYGNDIRPTARGLILGERLAEFLEVNVGDPVYIKPLSGKIKRTYKVTVTGTVKEYIGLNAYADMRFLTALLDSDTLVNSLLLRVEKGKEDRLSRWLKGVPAVLSSSIKQNTLQMYYDALVRGMRIMNVFLLYLSGVIAFAIIYNSSTISIMERTRELATLRVMGFTIREVSKIIFYENYLLSLLGLIVGYPFGMLICRLLVFAYETELYEWPYYIQGKTFAISGIFILLFVTIANFISRRRVKRLDLIEALKTRE